MKRVDPADVVNAEPLPRSRGHRLPATLAAIATRDALLREARGKFFPWARDREAARQLRTEIARFQAGAWRRERALPACPPRHDGKLPALLWQLLRARDAVPSLTTVRNAIRWPVTQTQSEAANN